MKLELNKGESRDSPEPFSAEELAKLFETPLYSGYLSASRPGHPGKCHVRDGRWWSGLVLLHTGMRAGELAQLLPGDFDFDATIPHIKIRLEDETGKKTKSAKNKNAVRDVPIAPDLLTLGLREFVMRRAQQTPKSRIFIQFNFGVNGRKSDGATKFWGSYLRGAGLWKPGRATHVWRHTLIAFLRASEVPQEDIAALIGHSLGTVTAGYGGAYPLMRKAKTLEKLNFGFDIVAAAGGPYNQKLHG